VKSHRAELTTRRSSIWDGEISLPMGDDRGASVSNDTDAGPSGAVGEKDRQYQALLTATRSIHVFLARCNERRGWRDQARHDGLGSRSLGHEPDGLVISLPANAVRAQRGMPVMRGRWRCAALRAHHTAWCHERWTQSIGATPLHSFFRDLSPACGCAGLGLLGWAPGMSPRHHARVVTRRKPYFRLHRTVLPGAAGNCMCHDNR
jgi:hypothetical protein